VSRRAALAGAAEVIEGRGSSTPKTTSELLAEAMRRALAASGLRADQVDGLGVSSVTVRPDHVVDVAWRLGRRLRWTMDDARGMGLAMLQHAVRAVEAGDASVIALLAGDSFSRAAFTEFAAGAYNSAAADHLSGIPTGGPNPLFALITQAHMRKHGLDRSAYGKVVIAQRERAATNPGARYRAPLGMDEYLAAPIVSDPLGLLDCVPVVAGAAAVIVAADGLVPGGGVRVRGLRCCANHDDQEGDGTTTALSEIAAHLWDEAGMGPRDMDVTAVYDDYPVMVLVQLEDLGFADDGGVERLVDEALATGRLAVNTSGGLLAVGQAGMGAGLHGLVECVRQLRGERGAGQVEGARTAVVTGYGNVVYRYGAWSAAAVLEAAS
jgi:acetyl-CoA acetyltransferase